MWVSLANTGGRSLVELEIMGFSHDFTVFLPMISEPTLGAPKILELRFYHQTVFDALHMKESALKGLSAT